MARKKADELSAEQTAALQLITIAPEPRTADELADSYAGQQVSMLWPEQDRDSVKSAVEALVSSGHAKEGAAAPDGTPTIVLADYEEPEQVEQTPSSEGEQETPATEEPDQEAEG